jgi:O-acetyl-ADP-ribose deacetylase (regulator of RNase III)
MIYEVEGDIMLTRAAVIAQGVSVNDPMTRGLGRKLSEKFPVMRDEFQQWCELTQPEPGAIWIWGNADKLRVVNLVTSEPGDLALKRPGRPTKIAINRCLRALARLVLEERLPSIALPKLGEGAGGVDWLEVRGMMHAQLGQLLIPLFVYSHEVVGMLASEPGM